MSDHQVHFVTLSLLSGAWSFLHMQVHVRYWLYACRNALQNRSAREQQCLGILYKCQHILLSPLERDKNLAFACWVVGVYFLYSTLVESHIALRNPEVHCIIGLRAWCLF